MRKRFKFLVGVFLIGILVYVHLYLAELDLVFREEVLAFEQMARAMNVNNLVSVIYLGPRIFDTFLEVMVVVLTVFGVKFVRRSE